MANRWNLLSNMRDGLERILHQRSAAIRDLLKEPPERKPLEPGPDAPPAPPIDPLVATQVDGPWLRKARFGEVRQLHEEGHSLRSIDASMGLHHRTVERSVRSDA